MSSVQIDFAAALGLGVLAAVLPAAAAFFFSRATVPPVSRARRALLTGLRAGAVGLIALLACEPVLHVRSTRSFPPVLAVLVDDSRSMRITDRTGDRAARLREVLRDPVFARLAGRAEVRYYRFGARLRPWGGSAEELPLDEGVTDIAAALHSLAESTPIT